MHAYELIERATESLRAAREALHRELAEYPTPVSGCDQQYNHLIAEQRRVRDALEALGADIFVATPRQQTPDSRIESR